METENWKERAVANETIVIPGPRNVRSVVFKDQVRGERIYRGNFYEDYPWLTNCNYKVLKEVFVPNGDYTQDEARTPKGTLTLVIEILNENQSPTE